MGCKSSFFGKAVWTRSILYAPAPYIHIADVDKSFTYEFYWSRSHDHDCPLLYEKPTKCQSHFNLSICEKPRTKPTAFELVLEHNNTSTFHISAAAAAYNNGSILNNYRRGKVTNLRSLWPELCVCQGMINYFSDEYISLRGCPTRPTIRLGDRQLRRQTDSHNFIAYRQPPTKHN